MNDSIWRENEIATNRVVGKGLLAFSCVLLAVTLCDFFGIVDMGAGWCCQVMAFCAIIVLAIAHIISLGGYKKSTTKHLVITCVLALSSISNFLYPMGSIFLFFGPVMMGIMYYDGKLTKRIALVSWLLYLLMSCANLYVDAKCKYMHDFHILQGTTIWGYWMDAIVYQVIPRSMIFGLTAFLAYKISQNGQSYINQQVDISTRAAKSDAELNAASNIQKLSMPEFGFTSPDGNITLSAFLQPARQVGGDFFDHFMLNDNLLVMLVADVSDKGMASAMFAIRAQSILRFAMSTNAGRRNAFGVDCVALEQALNLVNEQLSANNRNNFFVTLWACCIDCRSGVGKFVNAGHLPPIIRHADGSTSIIENEPQPFMGFTEFGRLHSGVFRLETGDSLVLYTDGVTDAANTENVMFGFDALKATVENAVINENPSESLTDTVAKAVLDYTGDADRFDDITVLTATFSGQTGTLEKRFTVNADSDGIRNIIDSANEIMLSNGCPIDVSRCMDTVIDDVCSNIVDYAYDGNGGDIVFTCRCNANSVVLEFRDNGPEFNPLTASEPQVDGEPQFGGLGIFLVKNITDSMEYRREDGQNVLTLTELWNM